MYEDEVMDVNAAEPVYQDETLVCKECGKEFVFTAGESSASMRRKASRTSRAVARSAVRRSAPRTAALARSAKCSPRSARIAAPLHG